MDADRDLSSLQFGQIGVALPTHGAGQFVSDQDIGVVQSVAFEGFHWLRRSDGWMHQFHPVFGGVEKEL